MQHVEIVARSKRPNQMLRMRAAHVHLDEGRIGKKAAKDVVLVAVSRVFGIRKEARVLADIAVDGTLQLAIGLRDSYDFFCIRNREQSQSGAIQNRENTSV